MSINFFMNICTTSKNGLSVSRVSTQIGHYAKQLWQYRLWIFQERDTKLEMFLAKNQLCRGADYAPHTTASPPGFKKLSTPLSRLEFPSSPFIKTFPFIRGLKVDRYLKTNIISLEFKES